MKYTLHVGINEYDPGFYGPGNDLKMCVDDAATMAVVSQEFGFVPRFLANETATRRAWQQLVAELAAEARRGDVVFITQSSHGTYQDLTPGRRATALCMHDQPLWDYEVRESLKGFRAGVVVVWLTDCCFAESNWRFWHSAPIGQLTPHKNVTRKFLPLTQRAELKPTQGDARSIRATLLTYSASGLFQVAYEDEQGGVFTQAVAQALRLEAPLSYYQLHRRASLLISERNYPQTPIFEGVRAAAYTGSPFLSNVKTEK